MQRLVRRALWVVAAGLGVLSLVIARDNPGYSFAGDSAVRSAVELGTGWILLSVGAMAWSRRPGSRFGRLLVGIGCSWFIVEWNNPGTDSALIFTIGLSLYAATPALVAHAALAYPEGRLPSWPDRLGVGLAYGGAVLLLGFAPALVFDPRAQGCAQCPRNLLLVHGSAPVYEALNQIGTRLGVVWPLALILLIALRLHRWTPAMRRLGWPVLTACGVYLALVAADFGRSLARGVTATDRTLWLGEAAALVALSLGVTWSWLRGRRTRTAVARLVVDLAESPTPGGLRDALARTLGDPSLRLGYPLGDGRLVDAAGRPLILEEGTPLVRGGEQLALLSHRPGLLDDPGLVEEVAVAARLVLENERLQAETRAQLEDLRTSRARIIANGDAERRRLERDLHDGAQQHLVSLMLSLRVVRSRLGSDADPSLLERIDAAEGELSAAFAELRELAHGIFPAILTDEGLAAALETLAEEAPIPVRLLSLPAQRCGALAEAAGYFLVLETVRTNSGSMLTVSAERRDDRLHMDVQTDRIPEGLRDVADRMGALDGTVEVVDEPHGRVRIRAEIPCG